VLGSTTPRLYTPPLITGPPGPCGCGCAHTESSTYGFGVITFADRILETPLDPWERWLVIHAGELLPDGRPRFRKVLVMVARQNGKTFLLVVLSLYWLFVERVRLVLGTSTNLDYAKESWEAAVEMAENNEILCEDIPAKGGVRRTNGEQTFTIRGRCRYKIATSTRKGGRSLTVHRLVLDELREHNNWQAWNAAYNAMNAVKHGQAFAITNQGDASAVVLDSLRRSGLKLINTGKGDIRLGLFEWSAAEGSSPTDPLALAAANPNLGRRIQLEDLLTEAERAVDEGGEELALFTTEVLCMRVPNMNPAIDALKWRLGHVPGDLSAERSRVVMCVDVSMDQQHAVAVAGAVTADGQVRVDVVEAWSGPGAARQLRAALPRLVAKVKPVKVGWFPAGPAAAIATSLTSPKKGRQPWAPAGVEVDELRADVTAICMGLAEEVFALQVIHSNDPLLDAHVEGAEKLKQGDVWRFTRRGAGHCNAAYAVAGVVHLARTLPPPPSKPVFVRRSRRPVGKAG
jgi:hypothetical protein